MPTLQKPNILYIHSHDTGRYVQPYGYNIPTPRIQALAEEGILFRQNFCINPTCSPSRASLLTGEYPHQNGMTGLAHRGHKLNDYSRHLAQFLKRNGYTTALAGVQHEAAQPEWIGYDQVLSNPTDAAVAYLQDIPEQPFFLSVGYNETHRKFPEASPAEDSRYTAPPGGLPDTPEVREDMARFKASARILDEKMGTVLRALEEAGLKDNTLVICTTDHGIAFPRMKCNLTDAGTGTMLIMRGPGGFEGGRVCDQMTTHMDLYPTICNLAGLQPPAWLQGRNLLPWVCGDEGEIHDAVFTQVNYHGSYEPMRAVRTQRYKYIKRGSDRRHQVGSNCDAGPSKDVWVQNGWMHECYDGEELYDLVFDPCERRNLIEHPEKQEVLADMRRRLHEWQQETGDPLLLAGHVAAPQGCIMDDINNPEPGSGITWHAL